MLDVCMGILWYLVFVVSTTLHEASHALLAKWGGDHTAYHSGQVSIDPIPHMRREPIGMIALPILALVFYGWPIGYAHVPYDMNWAQRHPRRAALMSLAGPFANLSIVVLCAAIMRLGIAADVFVFPETVRYTTIIAGAGSQGAGAAALVLSIFFSMNLLLTVFNLLPVPPLDGGGVLPLFTSRKFAVKYQAFVEQPYMLLIGMMVAWNIFPKIFSYVYAFTISLLYPEYRYF